jgi:hypothetical protein
MGIRQRMARRKILLIPKQFRKKNTFPATPAKTYNNVWY